MSIYSLPNAIGAVSVFLVGLVVFLRNKQSKVNISFFSLCIVLFFWLSSYAITYSTNSKNVAYFFCRTACTAVLFTTPCLYLFFAHFLGKFEKEKKWIYICFGVMFLILPLFIFSNLFLDKPTKYFWGYYSTAGPLHPVYLIIWSVVWFKGLTMFLDKAIWSDNDISEKNKSKLALVLYFIPTFACIDYIQKYGIAIYPLGWFFIAIFAFAVGYAIIRHQFMDINVVFKKGLVYSILATIITAVYLIFIIGIGRLFQGIVGYQSFAVNLVAVFVIAILFNPLRDRIQHFLDKRFFQGTLESLAQERERLKQELFQAEKLAYVGQMASAIVHEIRNPLTVIETHLEYLPKKYEDPEFKRKFEHLIPKEIDRIKKVVNQLLGLAKPRKPILMPLNIISTIESTLNLLENNFKLKKINVKKEYQVEEITVNADEDQLKQVFLNLFLNSIQAMSEEGTLTVGVDLRPSIKTQMSTDKKKPMITDKAMRGKRASSVIIRVNDNGKGMTEETKQKLFTPFSTTKPDGIGLGLVIIKEIIEAHGGSIEVDSKEGEGTSFVIKLNKA